MRNGAAMDEEVRGMLQRLKFSEEEAKRVLCQHQIVLEDEGDEKWVMGKMLTSERIHKESMYGVLRSLWYTKEWVNFMEVEDNLFLIKFRSPEDSDKILSMAPWSFDQHILSLLPFVKDQDWQIYSFELVPFWIRAYNIPMSCMGRQLALEIGGAVGEVMAIDWRDKEGGWTEFMRIRVKLDTSKPLH